MTNKLTRPLLAGTLKDIQKLKFPVIATPKLDGIRVLKVNGEVVSRKFIKLPNNYIREFLKKLLPDGIDGEIMTPGSFNEVQSKIMRFEGEPIFSFHAFDYVKNDLSVPYEDRLKDLNSWWEDNHQEVGSIVSIVKPKLITNIEELDQYEIDCLQDGYEGVMVRSPQGKYKCGRSTVKEGILLKIKRFEDAEAVVLGFTEKMTNTNAKEKDEFGLSKRSHKKEGMIPGGTLGTLEVKDLVSGIEFGIGSGFSAALKQEIWNNRDSYINKIVKYKYQEVGVKDAPRFPVFLGFRHEDDL